MLGEVVVCLEVPPEGAPVASPVGVPGCGATFFWCRSHWSKSLCGTTLTSARMVAWPNPQSSVQTTL